MPYEIIKLKNHHVQVRNKDTCQIKAKKTTIEKAKKHIRLLEWKEQAKSKYL